jgi:hypothetical protein
VSISFHLAPLRAPNGPFCSYSHSLSQSHPQLYAPFHSRRSLIFSSLSSIHPLSIGYGTVHATGPYSIFDCCGVYILVASRRASHAFPSLPLTDRIHTSIHTLSIASMRSEMNSMRQSTVKERHCEPSSTWQASTAPIVIESGVCC